MLLRVASCLFLVLAAGCASRAHDAASARDYTLRPGEHITLPDHTELTYIGVAQDSRCPPQVQCIHAGSADVHLRHTGTGTARDITLVTGQATTTTLDARRVQLLDLAFGDAPALTLRVEPLP